MTSIGKTFYEAETLASKNTHEDTMKDLNQLVDTAILTMVADGCIVSNNNN